MVGRHYFITEQVSQCRQLETTPGKINSLTVLCISLHTRFNCSFIEGGRTLFQIVPAHLNPWLHINVEHIRSNTDPQIK